MRLMTEDEQRQLLTALAKNLNYATIISADEICYGSLVSSERAGKEYRYICDIAKAVPPDIIEAFNQERRKAEADKLRQKADAIERGQDCVNEQ